MAVDACGCVSQSHPYPDKSEPDMAQVAKVMVSSTFRDLTAERDGVGRVIHGQGMLALMYQQVGAVLGEANCISALSDVARAEGDTAAALPAYAQAPALYEQLHRMDNLALGDEDLARVTVGTERARHVTAARAA